jgi:hypothetical protein
MPRPRGIGAGAVTGAGVGATRIADGVLVVRGLLPPAATARLRRFLGTEFARHVRRGSIEEVFGSGRAGDRRSFPVAASHPAVQPIEAALRDEGFLEQRVLGALTGLVSRPGGGSQPFHRDYPATTALPGATQPLSVLVAVQAGTRVGFPPHLDAATDVVLGPGDALAWEGQILHAGWGYDAPNLRLHLYLDTAQAVACPAQTHLLASARLQRMWTAALRGRRPAGAGAGARTRGLSA